MAVEIKVPEIGESITEVTIGNWLLNEGEGVEIDKTIAILESDKATVELPAQSAGTLTKILKKPGETARVGEVIALLEPEAAPAASTKPAPAAEPVVTKARSNKGEQNAAVISPATPPEPDGAVTGNERRADSPPTKEDPQELRNKTSAQRQTASAELPRTAPRAANSLAASPSAAGREEEVVPMTRLRRTIARRLVEAQQIAAMLTTFNEVDMSAVMGLRKQFGEAFQQKHGVKLGFMSFFVKASIDALKSVPQVNAEIRGDEIVYKNYFDVAVAIGGGKGLVVPVIRNAESLSFAELELAINDFAARARDNKLKPEELQGGTFTISNGGVYGSMLSTPIINPPQSGILGMHAIQERPVAREGQVVIRPMMYLALTYDHRLVDGREAVIFLKRIKEVIEDPARMLLET